MKLSLFQIPSSFTALGVIAALATIASTALVACGAREADLLPKRALGSDGGLVDPITTPTADGGPIDPIGCTTEARTPKAIAQPSFGNSDSTFRHLEVGDSSWFARFYDPGYTAVQPHSAVVTGSLSEVTQNLNQFVLTDNAVNSFALEGPKPTAIYFAAPSSGTAPVVKRRDLATGVEADILTSISSETTPVALAGYAKGVVWAADNWSHDSSFLFRYEPGWRSAQVLGTIPGKVLNLVVTSRGDVYAHVRPVSGGQPVRDAIFATQLDAQLPELPLQPYVVYESKSNAITGLAADSTHLYFYETTIATGGWALLRIAPPADRKSAPVARTEPVATIPNGWVPESIAIGRSYIAWRAQSGGVKCVRAPCFAPGTIWLKQKNLAGGAEEIPVTDEPLQGAHRVALVGQCDALIWTEQATVMRK